MEAINILKVESKHKLFKKEEEANAVELINLEGVGFDLIVQKDLYQVGDLVVYIQPDYCVENSELFTEFIAPKGDMSKSYLGKINDIPSRIRAKQFLLSKIPNGKKVYSNGIVLPLNLVQEFINEKYGYNKASITDASKLGVYKYEEPIDDNSDLGEFPSGFYQTDEENINNIWGELKFPVFLIGTEKVDGSSITISSKAICTRNRSIKRYIKVSKGKRKRTFWETITFQKPDLTIYDTVENDKSNFIKIGKQYQDLLISLKADEYVLRGELVGKGIQKSSVNLNSKEELNIKFYGIDIIEHGITKRLCFDEFMYKASVLNIPTVKVLFEDEFKSKEELIETCEKIFEENKNMEGIVIRDEGDLSAKYMNNYYYSKK